MIAGIRLTDMAIAMRPPHSDRYNWYRDRGRYIIGFLVSLSRFLYYLLAFHISYIFELRRHVQESKKVCQKLHLEAA